MGPGWAYSIARPWVPISSPLTHMVYLLLFVGYLAGSKKRFRASEHFRTSDPDTMTNTAQEATASSSCKTGDFHI